MEPAEIEPYEAKKGTELFIEQTDRFWPILLKKSALVTTAEKLAPEIEILKFGKGL